MITWLKNFLYKLVAHERSSRKLATSSAVGIYIAFSPFIGFHTPMVLAASWLFGLNLAVCFSVSVLINNPWTMIPVYGVGYLVGDYILHSLLGIDVMVINPSWMHYCNGTLAYYVGIECVSFWGFMLGGNLLGILFSVTLYPVMERIFSHLVNQKYSAESSADTNI